MCEPGCSNEFEAKQFRRALDKALPIMQAGGRYSHLLKLGDSIVSDSVPALAAELDRLRLSAGSTLGGVGGTEETRDSQVREAHLRIDSLHKAVEALVGVCEGLMGRHELLKERVARLEKGKEG